MNGQEIKDKVERYLDMTLKDNLIIDGIQEAINKLGIKGHVIDTILLEEIEIEEGEFYNMPSDWIRVIKVEKPDDNEYYYNYLIDGDLIRFQEVNKYRIFAQKHPFKYNDLDDNIDLHPMLVSCILDYVKGFVRLTNTDQNKVAWQYVRKFEEDTLQVYQLIKRDQKAPSRVRVDRKA